MKTVHLTIKSSNKKTGPIPVSTTSAKSCPDSCPLKKNGCYADGGPLALHWRAVTEGQRGMHWAEFCESIEALPAGQLWRHNQANAGKRGFTYTHKPASAENLALIREANAGGFTINLSANNLAHADQLAALNAGPVVTILPSGAPSLTKTPAGRPVVTCPAQLRDDISCADCQLCSRAQRPSIVGFIAHGAGSKRAEKISLQFQSKAL